MSMKEEGRRAFFEPRQPRTSGGRQHGTRGVVWMGGPDGLLVAKRCV